MARNRANNKGGGGLFLLLWLLPAALPAILLGAAYAGPILLVAAQLWFRVFRAETSDDFDVLCKRDKELLQLRSQAERLESRRHGLVAKIRKVRRKAIQDGLKPRSDGRFDQRNSRAMSVNNTLESLIDGLGELKIEINVVDRQIAARLNGWGFATSGRKGANWALIIYLLSVASLTLFISATTALAVASLVAISGGVLVCLFSRKRFRAVSDRLESFGIPKSRII